MAIIRCSCKNNEQDALHGPGKRVGNPTADRPTMWRCTVCLKEVSENYIVRK